MKIGNEKLLIKTDEMGNKSVFVYPVKTGSSIGQLSGDKIRDVMSEQIPKDFQVVDDSRLEQIK